MDLAGVGAQPLGAVAVAQLGHDLALDLAHPLARQPEQLPDLVERARLAVVEAEAQIPMAMAEAFRAGRLGVMDYYNMQNVQSDTAMRKAIAESSSPDMGAMGGTTTTGNA